MNNRRGEGRARGARNFFFACYSIERLHGNGGSHLHSVKS